jgi:hypothetical protein
MHTRRSADILRLVDGVWRGFFGEGPGVSRRWLAKRGSPGARPAAPTVAWPALARRAGHARSRHSIEAGARAVTADRGAVDETMS